ncbi:hypothetical protein GH733_015296 [Mirounga leonina]|nr:hypothetical protein GH733_015296 [Mirounga leonina]
MSSAQIFRTCSVDSQPGLRSWLGWIQAGSTKCWSSELNEKNCTGSRTSCEAVGRRLHPPLSNEEDVQQQEQGTGVQTQRGESQTEGRGGGGNLCNATGSRLETGPHTQQTPSLVEMFSVGDVFSLLAQRSSAPEPTDAAWLLNKFWGGSCAKVPLSSDLTSPHAPGDSGPQPGTDCHVCLMATVKAAGQQVDVLTRQWDKIAPTLHFQEKLSRKVALKSHRITLRNVPQNLGEKSVKEFKNKQQGDKIPKNKFWQVNKFNRKRKFQVGHKTDESTAKKPKWDDFKKKKEPKQSRQLSDKTNYDTVGPAKQIWEILRKDCDKEKRVKLMSDLQKGKLKLSHLHMIQLYYIQYGNEEQRKQAFEELRDDLVQLSKAKYFGDTKKFLKYGSKPQIAEIMRSFKGHMRKMLWHAEASDIVEYTYNDKAILEQRNMLREELNENTFYKSAYRPTLDKVLEVQPEKQELSMDEMKQILAPMAQKEADRKMTVKKIKTYVEKVANGQYSHLVFLTAIDCIDDTKIVKQIIISEIINSLPNIVNEKYGRKVLLHLLSPRDPAHTVQEIIDVLLKGGGNTRSKKDRAFHPPELLESISPVC